jgi:tetratricopeptide (TPR) repeat protein
MTKDVSMLEQANEIYSSALRCKEDRDYEQAVVLFRKAITILESEAATGSKLCHAFYQVGVCFRYLGNYDDSIQFLEKALASKVKKTDSFVSSVHHRLAIALRCRGEYASAIYHYQRAIAIQERQNPGIGSFPLVLSFVGLAAAYCELGNYHESEDLIDKAFAVVACIGSESEASGLTSYHYGILCEEKEKWDLAMENFVQARVIFENFQNHEMVASCEREIAMVNTRLGNYSRASEFLNRALRALMSTGRLTVELAAVYNAKGFLSTAKPDYDDALLYFAESEKILAETVSCSLEFAKTCAGIADVLLAQGNLADALWRFQQALSIYDCHHCRCSAVSTIAHKIEVLEAKIAAENEMQTGIRTAVAIPVAIQLQQSMVPGAPVVANRLHSAEIRSSTTHCPSVLAWPAEDNSFAGRLPLAESISGKLTILGEHHSPFGFTGSPLAKTPIFAETDFDCAEELLDSVAKPESTNAKSSLLESTRSCPKIAENNALILVVVNDDNQSDDNEWIATLNKQFELVVVDSPPSAISFLQEGTTMPDIIVSKLQLREESGDDLQLTPDNGALFVQLVRKAGHSIPIVTYGSSFIRLDLNETETIQLEGDGVVFGSQNLCQVISKCIADANQISTTREYEESAANSDLDIESPVGRLDNGNLSHSAIKNNDVPSPLGIQAPNDAETNDNQIQNAQLTGLDEVSERMPNVEGPTADAERCVGKRCTNAEPPAYYFSSELSDHDEDDLS